MEKLEIRTAYMRPLDVGIDCSAETFSKIARDGEPVMAEQSHSESCDINVILRRHGTAAFVRPEGLVEMFQDNPVMDYQEAMNAVVHAQEVFSQLPAEMRKRFDNDPAQLVAFVSDRSNLDEAVKLGLVDKKALPASTTAAPASGTPSPAPTT